MDKRLNQIKSDWNNDNIGVGSEEVKWLIQRVKYLEERHEKMKKEFAEDIDFKRKQVNDLENENQRYKQALEEIESRALQEINLGGQLDPEEVVEIVRQHL